MDLSISALLSSGLEHQAGARGDTVAQILGAVRRHLEMDVAFVSEFFQGQRVFRHVDSTNPRNPIKPGAGDPLEASFCKRVVDGHLPQLMRDARRNPVSAALDVTHALPVGAHLSVPIRLSDGSTYGTFCCFSFTADESLDERDLKMMRAFAEVTAKLIEAERAAVVRKRELKHKIRKALSSNKLSTAYQPIYDLVADKIVGVEALSRFQALPLQSPDIWFGEANEVGLGVELESRAIQLGLRALEHLPLDMYVSVNISPQHILDGAMAGIFSNMPLDRVVLEITEHSAVAEYDGLASQLAPFRARGMRIAVDDAGAGYASFRHILNLAPDRIKLDMSLTRNIDRDGSRRALAAAFIRFAEETGAKIIAEGVETQSELDTLKALGVSTVQGHFVGRPAPIGDLLTYLH
ncbi:EAL domain, c-di-GMP-specific phosphodiesterase class I (or its enzymatically inactive variant) [Noviherbaspirillum humi]|uniref:EAL domain, c-di-GMP-specific phosphodiesterase class I (Or its enzymatically inactive variant) n=1 Tax=Noviherbaspirillum humi TaxID=1688639 RepID=A0A239EVC6_9BURK|nr:EAL domain-containing protein [Noviherbaspirillum humi]SNS48228.1 EAL domain, c-di-GMP-specific phosphodiesterase class I (or its enzymatically inactive variant) [Noviherbaspirillum humi]